MLIDPAEHGTTKGTKYHEELISKLNNMIHQNRLLWLLV
jgi:hypothetical protein